MLSITANENQLENVANKLLQQFPEERIFCFYGEMGSGKTTLIKKICENLGVQNITSSPTFAIVNEYHGHLNVPIYHFDFYRIDDIREAEDIGFQEYLYSGSYCFIEWTEKVEELLDDIYVRVNIERIDDSTRKFTAQIIQ